MDDVAQLLRRAFTGTRWTCLFAALVCGWNAFFGFAPLVLLSLGFLSFLFRDGTSLQLLARGLVWGGLYAGVFHAWILRSDVGMWCLGLLLRGGLWCLLPLPYLLARRHFAQRARGLFPLCWGLGLGLVAAAQLATPFGFDWECHLTALTDYPFCLALLPWLGIPGLTMLIGVICSLAAETARQAKGLALALLALWLGTSWWMFSSQPAGLPESFPKIALIQTGWTQHEKWDAAKVRQSKLRLGQLTDLARRSGAELVVWPETAWPVNGLLGKPREKSQISDLSRRLAVSILASSLEKPPQGWTNSVSLVTPEGEFSQTYHKRRLIPIQEYLPGPRFLEQAIRTAGWARTSCHYTSGEQAAIWSLHGVRYAPLICYETTVPWISQALRDEVDFFVVVTNGATLYSEFAKQTHFRSAILRAIQARRPVLQASNDGVTGVVDGRGVVLRRLPPGDRGPNVVMVESL